MLKQAILGILGSTIARPLVAKNQDESLLPPIERAAFITEVPLVEPVLEIGPFDRPRLSGPTIRYFDVLSQDQLMARAVAEKGRNPDGCPVIHYVSPTADFSVVKDEFSTVFSSHCIEHQPDLVGHLRAIARLLRRGGKYHVIVPDKRFCFDHFLAESSLQEVREAEGRSRHSEEAISKHTLGTTHNVSILHWLGFHGSPATYHRAPKSLYQESLKRAREGEYVDVHAWQFTPTSFRKIIEQLSDEGAIQFELSRIHNTGFGKFEFMAILTRV